MSDGILIFSFALNTAATILTTRQKALSKKINRQMLVTGIVQDF